jgi:hypothetical protein
VSTNCEIEWVGADAGQALNMPAKLSKGAKKLEIYNITLESGCRGGVIIST